MHSIIDFWKNRTERPPVVYTYVPEPVYRQKPPAEMVRMAAEQIAGWERSGANCPPVFMPDFGTVTMAKPWGGKVVTTDDGQIFIHPVSRNIDEILDIEPGRNPDIELAVDLYRQVCSATGRSDIRFVSADYQGVLGTASQIMQQDDLMIAMIAEPKKVHRFLDLVCERNIAFMQDLMARVRIDGGLWPYIWLPQEIGIVITEDFMPLLSPVMYAEFALQYLKRIADAFGGVFVHSCGQWIHHARTMADSGINYLGIDFCYPYTRLEEIQEYLPGLVLQPGFEFNKKSEYDGYPAFLDAMLGKRRGGTCLWLAMNSNELWQFDKVREVLHRHGVEFDGFAGRIARIRRSV